MNKKIIKLIFILSLKFLLTYANKLVQPSKVEITKIVINPVNALLKLIASESGLRCPLVQTNFNSKTF